MKTLFVRNQISLEALSFYVCVWVCVSERDGDYFSVNVVSIKWIGPLFPLCPVLLLSLFSQTSLKPYCLLAILHTSRHTPSLGFFFSGMLSNHIFIWIYPLSPSSLCSNITFSIRPTLTLYFIDTSNILYSWLVYYVGLSAEERHDLTHCYVYARP